MHFYVHHPAILERLLLFTRIPQDNLRAVSVATGLGSGFDLRPGENMGVHVAVMHDTLNRDGSLARVVSVCVPWLESWLPP